MQCTCKSCKFDTSFAISEVNFTTGSRAGRRAGSKANMAGQLLAAKLIPSLGITGLAATPPGKLASHDFIHLLFHHQHYKFLGFNGLRSICCVVDGKTKKGRCHEEGDPTSLWLQNLIISVAALRKRCVGHKASNSNILKWQAAVRGVLKLG